MNLVSLNLVIDNRCSTKFTYDSMILFQPLMLIYTEGKLGAKGN